MSCYILEKDKIELLTKATDVMLQLNARYSASYPLNRETVQLLGKYAGNAHALYRALYITNLKAYNGRYDDGVKEFPRFTGITVWNPENLNPAALEKATDVFGEYMYQISEDPICGGDMFLAIADVYKLLCMYIIKRLR